MAEAVVVAGAIEAASCTGTPPFKGFNWISLSGAGSTERSRDLGESSSLLTIRSLADAIDARASYAVGEGSVNPGSPNLAQPVR
jgi:hypothetical protein